MNQIEHLSKSIGLLTANIKEKMTKCNFARPYLKHRGGFIDSCEKKEDCEFQFDFGTKKFCKKTLPKHLTGVVNREHNEENAREIRGEQV